MSELPQGWARCHLPDIAEIALGKMLDAKRTAGTSLPYLRNINVRWGRFNLSDLQEMPFQEHELERFGIRDGDVLVCEGGEPGRAAVWRSGATTIKYQKALHRVRPHEHALDPEWVVLHLRHGANGDLRSSFSGTTIKHLTGVSFARYPFALPPINEQRRIVAKVEALTARSRGAREALEQVPPLLERFRQSVLAAAFRGDLTAEWRRQHPDVEPASLLLERVRSQRERPSRWNGEVSKTGLPPLPQQWSWGAWSDLADRVTVGYVGPMVEEYRENGIPFLRSQNVRENRFEAAGLLYVSAEFHAKINKSALRPGDLVVVRSGSVGVTCVIPGSIGTEANCSDVVVIQRPRGVLPSYGAYYMNSAARGRVRAGSVGMALTHFNTKSVAGLPVPVPPLEEQTEIVRILDARMDLTRVVESVAREQLMSLARLDQATLANAFRGRLVSQDPADEPASLLLDRLRTERGESEAADGPKTRRPRGPRAPHDAPEPTSKRKPRRTSSGAKP